MAVRTEAKGTSDWSNNIPIKCPHCGATNYISNNSNFWICWHCKRDLK
ncbi:MAG: hypothetical protein LBJ91_04470 [Clostridiales Family XIII bacterium]|nr:hypothetical protein [Clostridiales Family XIII bacterium]